MPSAPERCGIHPERRAAELARSELDELWQAPVDMMRRAVDDGRIVAVPHSAGADLTPEQDACMIYERDSCRR